MPFIDSPSVFASLPLNFVSGFPSNDYNTSAKVAALNSNGLSSIGLATRQQAETVTLGMQMVFREKAVQAGDFLTSQLSAVLQKGVDDLGLPVVNGLFQHVNFPTSAKPADLLNAVVDVGLDVALGAIGAVPIVNRIAQFAVNLGRFIVGFIAEAEENPADVPVLLPWETYNRETDQDIVNDNVIKELGGKPAWTSLFMPPLKGEWRYELAIKDGKKYENQYGDARVFAALNGNDQIAWAPGLGGIPGSLRVAGQIQTFPQLQQCGGGPCGLPETLRQRVWVQNFRQDFAPRPPRVIDGGAFYPALAVVSAQLAETVMRSGGPDLFKVRADVVRAAWQEYWQAFFAGGFQAAKKNPWVWAAMAPYVCQVTENGKRVTLGIQDLDRPHLGPLVWPGIFEQGVGEPALRTFGAWYVDGQGRQVTTFNDRFTVLEAGPGPAVGNRILTPTDISRVRPGVEPVPWPSTVEQLSEWRRPDVAITTPWCNRLAARQLHSLEASLVCAYVRPDPVGDLARYEAFEDANLRTKCRALRELLLTHPARFGVDLPTAEAVDPKFAERLRGAGVTGKVQFDKLTTPGGKPPKLVDDPPPDPQDEEPADGLGFDDLRLPGRGPGPETSSRLPAILAGLAGTAAAAGAVAYALHRPASRSAAKTRKERHALRR